MTEFAEASARQWAEIVEQAKHLRKPIDEIAACFADKNTSEGSIKGRVKAIRWALSEGGWTIERIIAEGQTVTLSAYARYKRNGHEKERVLSWRVSKSLADAVMSSETSPDQDEALASRLVRVLGMQTSEQFWEFLHSVFANLSDAELKNLGGAFTERDAPRRRRK